MNRKPNRSTRSFLGLNSLALVIVALTALCVATEALAVSEEDLPSGRLGYTWVPDPPKPPRTAGEELGLDIAKYGGAGLVGLWVLRKMFGGE